MNPRHMIEAEKTDLALHVDLCAERFGTLDKRLEKVEKKLDELHEEITIQHRGLSKVIITTTGTVIASVLALVITLLVKF